MKIHTIALSLIAFGAFITSAHAQITAADFSETLTLVGNSNNTFSATGQSTSYTLSENPVSSGATVSNPSSLQGSVDLTLSSTGLITLTDNSSGLKTYTSLTFSLSNIQFSGNQIISGITDITNGAIQSHSGSTLVFSQPFADNSVSLQFATTSPSTDTLAINGSTFTTSTYQLQFTAVPEPREWAMYILLGFGGLVVIRKLRERFVVAA